MSKFPNVIKLLEEKIEKEENYIEVAKREGMPKMEKYYQKRVTEYRKAVKVLSVA